MVASTINEPSSSAIVANTTTTTTTTTTPTTTTTTTTTMLSSTPKKKNQRWRSVIVSSYYKKNDNYPPSKKLFHRPRKVFLFLLFIILLMIYVVVLVFGLTILHYYPQSQNNNNDDYNHNGPASELMWESFLESMDQFMDSNDHLVVLDDDEDDGADDDDGFASSKDYIHDDTVMNSTTNEFPSDDEAENMNRTNMNRTTSSVHRDGNVVLRSSSTKAYAKVKLNLTTMKHRHKAQHQPKKQSQSVVDILYQAPPELKLPKPIINVGFPKAGTSTIFTFFHCNGLSSQHWYCCDQQEHPQSTPQLKLMSDCAINNLAKKNLIFQDCGDYDVYTEINGPRNFNKYDGRTRLDDGTMLSKSKSLGKNGRIFFPQHHRLKDIHIQYPNATFLLHLRPVEAWVESVLKWDTNLEYHILNEFFFHNETNFLFVNPNNNNHNQKSPLPLLKSVTGQDSPFIQQSDMMIRHYLIKIFQYHTRYIRDFVSHHPSHTLIEVDISNKESGTILADTFGLNSKCWGHYNQNQRGGKGGRKTKHKKLLFQQPQKEEIMSSKRRYYIMQKEEQHRLEQWRKVRDRKWNGNKQPPQSPARMKFLQKQEEQFLKQWRKERLLKLKEKRNTNEMKHNIIIRAKRKPT